MEAVKVVDYSDYKNMFVPFEMGMKAIKVVDYSDYRQIPQLIGSFKIFRIAYRWYAMRKGRLSKVTLNSGGISKSQDFGMGGNMFFPFLAA